MKKVLFLCLAICFLAPESFHAQKKKKKKKGKTEVLVTPTKPKSKKDIKKYSEVITKDAVSDKGLFDLHKVKKAYFYEIPFSKLNKDMLWVSRVAKTPTGLGGGLSLIFGVETSFFYDSLINLKIFFPLDTSSACCGVIHFTES